MSTVYELAKTEFAPPATVEELRTYLQAALEIEHLTIPVYLTGLYSILPGTNAYGCEVIRGVVLEEMLHLTLAANLLNAVGGTPDLSHVVRSYPARLPFGAPSLPLIKLRHYSPEALKTFMRIELPRSLVPPDPHAPDRTWTSIGQFYGAVRTGLDTLEKAARKQNRTIFTGPAGRQLGPADFYNSGGEVFPVTGLRSALLAVDVISEQGEGSQDTIWDSDDKIFGEERQVAHYFRFKEIHEGRRYGKHDLPRSAPSGPLLDITWEDAYTIDPDAKLADYAGNPELHQRARKFNALYAFMMGVLELTFQGSPALMSEAVPLMLALRDESQRLYRNPHPKADLAAKGVHASPTYELDAKLFAQARAEAAQLAQKHAELAKLPAQTTHSSSPHSSSSHPSSPHSSSAREQPA
ncbi:ferritin-like protein [Streptomyces sp. NPDC048442]|uniref:ferritin-like domain-containing protein n=1 Tax=Streptomyces sp. NPDC048442 TaxID=3154823 RepID=UPI0034493C4F